MENINRVKTRINYLTEVTERCNKVKLPLAITSLIVPLFISSISRSDELANAMEARNYNPIAKRTRYRNLHWHLSDTISMILSFVLMAGYVALLILFNNNIFDLNSIIISFFTYIYEVIKGWF